MTKKSPKRSSRQEIMLLRAQNKVLTQKNKDLRIEKESLLAEKQEEKNQKEGAHEVLIRFCDFFGFHNPFHLCMSYQEIYDQIAEEIFRRKNEADRKLASARTAHAQMQEEGRIRIETLQDLIAFLANK